MINDPTIFEAQLLAWTKSDSKGSPPTVTLMLLSDEAVEWFAQFQTRKGTKIKPIDGQAFDCVFQISEQDVQQKQATPDDTTSKSRLAQDAYFLCQSEVFYKYITDYCQFNVGRGDSNPIVMCRRYVLNYCHIDSRSELNHNEDAAALFKEMYRSYGRWVESIKGKIIDNL